MVYLLIEPPPELLYLSINLSIYLSKYIYIYLSIDRTASRTNHHLYSLKIDWSQKFIGHFNNLLID